MGSIPTALTLRCSLFAVRCSLLVPAPRSPVSVIRLELDLIQTLALAAPVYYAGLVLRRRVRFLDRLNVPSAVLGGLVFALLATLLRGVVSLELDTGAQPLFMVAFFTSLGMEASLALLRAGGVQVVLFLAFATVFCFVQNGAGMAIAGAFGESPLFGLMAGSATLVGGPATGLAFAPLFEEAGLPDAATLAVASATIGIVAGGIVGGPVATRLVHRHRLEPATRSAEERARELEDPPAILRVELDREDTALVRNMVLLAAAMGLGSLLGARFQAAGLTLPAYVGAMVVASVFRNLDDATGRLGVDQRAMEFMGGVALNIFLVVALMDLKLWALAGQALPLFAILAAQVGLVVLAASTVSFRLMGRDYDSGVMAGGFVGFALGTTANALANMRTLVERFGPAPRAFLVVPLVGAFFIDFTNALIITLFVNWLH